MTKETATTQARVDRLENQMAHVTRFLDKAEQYKVSDPEGSLVNARKAAEAICKRVYRDAGYEKDAKPAKKMMLEELTLRLSQGGKIPDTIFESLKTIQRHGNLGAHDRGEESDPITPAFVTSSLAALSEVVTWFAGEYGEHDFAPELREKDEIATPDFESTQGEALPEAARRPWKEPEDKDRAAELWERIQKALELKVRKITSSRLTVDLPDHDREKLELHHRPYVGLVLSRDDMEVADLILARRDFIEGQFGGRSKGFRLEMERNSAKKRLITLEDEDLTDRVLRNRKKNKGSGKKLPVTPAEQDWDDVCQFFSDNYSRFVDVISKHLEDARNQKTSGSSRSDTRESPPSKA